MLLDDIESETPGNLRKGGRHSSKEGILVLLSIFNVARPRVIPDDSSVANIEGPLVTGS